MHISNSFPKSILAVMKMGLPIELNETEIQSELMRPLLTNSMTISKKSQQKVFLTLFQWLWLRQKTTVRENIHNNHKT